MIHPHTELRYISAEKGYGVVATQFIPKGTITWVFDPLDQVFTPEKVSQLPPIFQKIVNTYTYRDQKGDYILCWDHARFVNHSFRSSCISTAYNFEMAVRDIYPGEELTDDYGYLNVSEPFACLPEPGTNRTKVMPNDLLHYHGEWDAQIKDAFKYFNQVAQPLGELIENQYQEKVKQIAAGLSEPDSILNCYYQPVKIALAV